MNVGEYILQSDEIELNAGREVLLVQVQNIGDRPVQIGSHFHFFEVNDSLIFDRDTARGFRLNIPAGTATRFEPGQTRSVQLVKVAGLDRIYGFQGRVMGAL